MPKNSMFYNVFFGQWVTIIYNNLHNNAICAKVNELSIKWIFMQYIFKLYDYPSENFVRYSFTHFKCHLHMFCVIYYRLLWLQNIQVTWRTLDQSMFGCSNVLFYKPNTPSTHQRQSVNIVDNTNSSKWTGHLTNILDTSNNDYITTYLWDLRQRTNAFVCSNAYDCTLRQIWMNANNLILSCSPFIGFHIVLIYWEADFYICRFDIWMNRLFRNKYLIN